MNQRVSVVIPSFNNADTIDETVRSVLDQTFADFELVISDHSSTDGTWARLQQFADDPRVRLMQVSQGGGAERNWNAVSAAATGDLVKLVCGDDLLHATCLERQVEAFDAHPTSVMVASRRDIIDGSGRVFVRNRGLRGMNGLVAGPRAARAALRAGTNVFGEPACVLLRREALEQAGWWDGTHGYVIDLATYLNVLEQGDLVALPDSMAAFRVTAGQWSMRLEREQARQVADFRRRVHARRPGLASRRDLLQGALMTQVQTAQRRIAYRVLAFRAH